MQRFNPVVSFLYFLFVIGFSMVFLHPVCLLISLISGFLCLEKKSLKTFVFAIPLLILTALLNPLFSHEGATVLWYFPNGNPLTLESIIYGLSSAAMLFSVILHFSSFNKIMTSDKIIYIFGKITPSFSLILSMIFRFVPKFREDFRNTIKAQKCLGNDIADGNILKKAKNGLKVMSIMITHSMESSIDTADSMKSRGYGVGKRTSYSNYKFTKKDIFMSAYILTLSLYIIAGGAGKRLYFQYFPTVKGEWDTKLFIAYLLLFISPIIIKIWEVARWKKLKSKI